MIVIFCWIIRRIIIWRIWIIGNYLIFHINNYTNRSVTATAEDIAINVAAGDCYISTAGDLGDCYVFTDLIFPSFF